MSSLSSVSVPTPSSSSIPVPITLVSNPPSARERAQQIVFYDIETTFPPVHLLEFAGIIVDKNRLFEIGCYSTLIRPVVIPPDKSPIDQRSLDCNGIADHMLVNAPTFREVAQLIFDVMDGRIWAGHNIKAFDDKHIRAAFKDAGLPIPTCAGTIDTLSIMKSHFGKDKAGNLKMDTLSQYFGFGAERHRALDDCRKTIDVLKCASIICLFEQAVPELYPNTDILEDGIEVDEEKTVFSPVVKPKRTYTRKPKPTEALPASSPTSNDITSPTSPNGDSLRYTTGSTGATAKPRKPKATPEPVVTSAEPTTTAGSATAVAGSPLSSAMASLSLGSSSPSTRLNPKSTPFIPSTVKLTTDESLVTSTHDINTMMQEIMGRVLTLGEHVIKRLQQLGRTDVHDLLTSLHAWNLERPTYQGQPANPDQRLSHLYKQKFPTGKEPSSSPTSAIPASTSTAAPVEDKRATSTSTSTSSPAPSSASPPVTSTAPTSSPAPTPTAAPASATATAPCPAAPVSTPAPSSSPAPSSTSATSVPSTAAPTSMSSSTSTSTTSTPAAVKNVWARPNPLISSAPAPTNTSEPATSISASASTSTSNGNGKKHAKKSSVSNGNGNGNGKAANFKKFQKKDKSSITPPLQEEFNHQEHASSQDVDEDGWQTAHSKRRQKIEKKEHKPVISTSTDGMSAHQQKKAKRLATYMENIETAITEKKTLYISYNTNEGKADGPIDPTPFVPIRWTERGVKLSATNDKGEIVDLLFKRIMGMKFVPFSSASLSLSSTAYARPLPKRSASPSISSQSPPSSQTPPTVNRVLSGGKQSPAQGR